MSQGTRKESAAVAAMSAGEDKCDKNSTSVVLFNKNINLKSAITLLDKTEFSVGAIIRNIKEEVIEGIIDFNGLKICKAGLVHASLVDKANCLFKAVVNHGAAAAKPDIFWQPRDPSASLCQPIYSLEGSISPTISLVQTSFKEARQGINLEPVVTADLMASKATKRPSSRKNKHVVSGGEASGQCATMKKDHVVDVVMFHPNINFEAAQILLDTTELSVGAVLRHLDKSTMSGLTQWNDLFVCKAEPSSSKEREMAKAIHRSISNFGVAAGVPDWEWTPQKAEECRLDARHYVLPLSGNLDELEGAAVEVENLAASAEAKLDNEIQFTKKFVAMRGIVFAENFDESEEIDAMGDLLTVLGVPATNKNCEFFGRRWKNLKDYYVKQLKLVPKKKSTSWPYMAVMAASMNDEVELVKVNEDDADKQDAKDKKDAEGQDEAAPGGACGSGLTRKRKCLK